MYQPTLGRFLSRDPAASDGVDVLYDSNGFGQNLERMRSQYMYCANNPVNSTDPSGLSVWAGPLPESTLLKGAGGKPCALGEPATQAAAVGWWDAWTAKELSNEALKVAGETGLPGSHNGPQDAFRHCYWSCRMAQRLGARQAKRVTDVHEWCGPSIPTEITMEQHNNEVGRELQTKDCKSACLVALQKGKLQLALGPTNPNALSGPIGAYDY